MKSRKPSNFWGITRAWCSMSSWSLRAHSLLPWAQEPSSPPHPLLGPSFYYPRHENPQPPLPIIRPLSKEVLHAWFSTHKDFTSLTLETLHLWQACARGVQIHSSGQGLFMQGLARGLLPWANQWGENNWSGSSGCRICFWNWEECDSPAWDWVCYCSNPCFRGLFFVHHILIFLFLSSPLPFLVPFTTWICVAVSQISMLGFVVANEESFKKFGFQKAF